MKFCLLRDYLYTLIWLLNVPSDHCGEGGSHIQTLMIYLHGIKSKCALPWSCQSLHFFFSPLLHTENYYSNYLLHKFCYSKSRKLRVIISHACTGGVDGSLLFVSYPKLSFSSCSKSMPWELYNYLTLNKPGFSESSKAGRGAESPLPKFHRHPTWNSRVRIGTPSPQSF